MRKASGKSLITKEQAYEAIKKEFGDHYLYLKQESIFEYKSAGIINGRKRGWVESHLCTASTMNHSRVIAGQGDSWEEVIENMRKCHAAIKEKVKKRMEGTAPGVGPNHHLFIKDLQ